MEFVELTGGLTVPEADIRLLWALEDRGMAFGVEGDKLRIKRPDGQKVELAPEEVSHIKARKAHLMALVAYQAPA